MIFIITKLPCCTKSPLFCIFWQYYLKQDVKDISIGGARQRLFFRLVAHTMPSPAPNRCPLSLPALPESPREGRARRQKIHLIRAHLSTGFLLYAAGTGAPSGAPYIHFPPPAILNPEYSRWGGAIGRSSICNSHSGGFHRPQFVPPIP